MRTSRFAALAALGFALALAACDTSGPTPPPDQVNLLPLEVGNRWTMEYMLTDSTRHVYDTRIDTVGVLRDTVVRGERWYYVALLGPYAHLAPLQGFFANREDGMYRLVRRGDGRLVPSLYYSTVAAPGAAYEIEVGYQPGITETATMTLLAANEPLDVPGVGEVSTYHYRRTTTSLEMEAYGEPIDVEGLTTDIRLSPLHGPIQQQSVLVLSRMRLEWLMERGPTG